MYLRRFAVENIRSVNNAVLTFEEGKEAGWHVVLGSNGAGKSTMIRSFAIVMMGEKEAYASRQDFESWLTEGQTSGKIEAQLSADYTVDDLYKTGAARKRAITINFQLDDMPDLPGSLSVRFGGSGHQRTVWGPGAGWFSASFGPFRRFTGGDNRYDRLFVTNKRLAPHLTALGEDVALTDALNFLSGLYLQTLQDEKHGVNSGRAGLFNAIKEFINRSNFLPYNGQISHIDGETVKVTDGNGVSVPIDQLSDGYRSSMSMVFELIRQMVEIYGVDLMTTALSMQPGTIQAPGVVMIDEVDVHLHPTWQRSIGKWLTKCFPLIQFIVTTHSPLICRAVADDAGVFKGSIWKLPSPGTDAAFTKVEGIELNQLVFGDVFDAFATELFGEDIIRSPTGDRMLERLAFLNLKALDIGLGESEELERRELRQSFPEHAGILGASDA